MKYRLLLVLLASYIFVPGGSVWAAPIAPGAFSMTWQTDNAGLTGNNQIRFGLGDDGVGDTCSGVIYWEEVGNATNNGSSTLNVSCSYETITFPSPGIYRVDVLGTHPSFRLNYSLFGLSDATKLLTIEQWGSNTWLTLANSFRSATNMTLSATDVPDLSSVTNINSTFAGASSFNSNINNWDVSNVTTIAGMFSGASVFNQPLTNWDVSNVIDMQSTFSFTNAFNQDISMWNVSSVTNMRELFREATAFNQPLNNWNVSNVTNMLRMFWDATSFNQPLDSWDVSNVTLFGGEVPYSDSGIFAGATAFNQHLNSWDISGITNFRGMFNGATAFNQPLDNWNVSNATDMRVMFNGATAFNQNISMWDVSNVSTMNTMFTGAGLSTQTYSAILTGWAGLPSLQSGVTFAASAAYCPSAQAGRDILTITNSWVISDSGSVGCYTLSYSAGTNATLVGSGSQSVEDNDDGTSVEVVPDAGYLFVQWSDGRTDNPRTDIGVTGTINVTAVIETLGSSGGGSTATRVGDRLKSSLSTTTTTTLTPQTVTKETFFDAIKKLLTYLQMNESKLAQLSASESKEVIVGLRNIVAYLLSLLPLYE